MVFIGQMKNMEHWEAFWNMSIHIRMILEHTAYSVYS